MLDQILKRFVRNIQFKYWLLLIIFIAFLLRVNRIDIGFPGLFLSNDEAIYHQSALNMLANKTPFTLGNYGPLGAYVQLPFILLAFLTMLLTHTIQSVKDMELLLLTQEGYLLFIPRVISVLFGCLDVIVIYKISKELFNDTKAAMWSAFFAAVSFNLVHVSHLARAWSPAVFFSLLALLFCIKSVKKGKSNLIIFSFVSAALSFGFHQLSGLVVLLVMLIFILHLKTVKLRFIGIGFIIWLFLIILFNYLSLQGNFWTVLTIGDSTSTGLTLIPNEPLNLNEWLEFFGKRVNIGKVIIDLLLTDGVLVLLALLFSFTKKFHLKINMAIWMYIAFNFLLISFIFPPFVRYFLVGFSFLPIFAGYVFSQLLKKNPSTLLVLAILFITSFNSIYWNIIISKKTTFELLEAWVNQKVSPQEMIVISQRRNFGFVPSKKSAEVVRKFVPGFYQRSSNILGDSYPSNVRDVIYIEAIDRNHQVENIEYMINTQSVKYVVTSYMYLDGRLPLEKDPKLKLVNHFSPTGNVINKSKIPEALFDAPYFMPLFRLERAGPYIDVFKVS